MNHKSYATYHENKTHTTPKTIYAGVFYSHYFPDSCVTLRKLTKLFPTTIRRAVTLIALTICAVKKILAISWA